MKCPTCNNDDMAALGCKISGGTLHWCARCGTVKLRDSTPFVAPVWAEERLIHQRMADGAKEATKAEAPPRDPATVCPGHETGGTAPPCCERAGKYNGFASGPTIFTCPKSCSCHD